MYKYNLERTFWGVDIFQNPKKDTIMFLISNSLVINKGNTVNLKDILQKTRQLVLSLNLNGMVSFIRQA